MNKNNNNSIAALRVLAIISVVWLHVTAYLVFAQRPAAVSGWWMTVLANAVSRWGVPIFVMTSGALLMPLVSDHSIFGFYKKRLGRHILPVAFWTLLFIGVEWAKADSIDWAQALRAVCLGRQYYHLWFIYMIIGLYLLAPILGRIVKNLDRVQYVIAVAGLFMAAFCVDTLARWYSWEISSIVEAPMYASYFLAGHYCTRYESSGRSSTMFSAAVVSALVFAMTTGFLEQRFGVRAWVAVNSYFNPFVIVMSLAVFCMMYRGTGREQSTAASPAGNIATYSSLVYGIYLMHPLWLGMFHHIGISGGTHHPVIGIPLLTTAMVLLSAASVHMMRKVPGLRAVV